MYSDQEEDFELEFDYEYESEFTYDNFIDYYKDDILFILEEMKSRFVCSPFFLSYVTLPILTNYIYNTLSNRGFVTSRYSEHFDNYYKQELQISYTVMYNFLKRFKITLRYNSWLSFCYKHTDLYEIQNYKDCD